MNDALKPRYVVGRLAIDREDPEPTRKPWYVFDHADDDVHDFYTSKKKALAALAALAALESAAQREGGGDGE